MVTILCQGSKYGPQLRPGPQKYCWNKIAEERIAETVDTYAQPLPQYRAKDWYSDKTKSLLEYNEPERRHAKAINN